MLDNNDINEQLANEAWERMRLLLDAEMPVAEDRRKRPVFWIWSKTTGIAATLLFSVLGIWWFASDTARIPSGHATLAGEYTQAALTLETSRTEMPQTAAQTQQAFVPEQSDEAALTGLNNTPSNHKSRFDAFKFHESAQVNSPFLKSDALPSAKEGTLLTANTPDLKNAVIVAEAMPSESAINGFIQEYPAVFQLPGLELTALPVEATTMGATAIPVDKLPGAWRHGPELGGIVSFPTSLGGFHAGWAAEMPIADGLALRGALRYDFQRQTVSSSDRQLSMAESTGDFSTDPFNPLQLGTSAVQPDTVISSTLKMHYAALPLSLSFKLTERWSVEGGVQVAYLFQAFRESRDDGSSSLVTNGTGFDNGSNNRSQSWYFSNKAQEVAAESFQPWDLAVSGGFRYQLSRHWNVGLSGNFGLLNQANKTNGYRVFNRNAVLSVGYYF
ncbi:MAG: outer membrane beta-barrel protein [Saprospiraceae bacterium]|nr:outer membrane beta-barrel protein [Saprospiraceae bacterium]MDZ4702979.1 outer membrane beta-barrel protein [Saprospiraceae bacterium]